MMPFLQAAVLRLQWSKEIKITLLAVSLVLLCICIVLLVIEGIGRNRKVFIINDTADIPQEKKQVPCVQEDDEVPVNDRTE